MDDEEENYFLTELLGANDVEVPTIRNQSPQKSSKSVSIPKAFNPIEELEGYPSAKRDSYYQLFMNSKVLPGIRGFFDLGEEEEISNFCINFEDDFLQHSLFNEEDLNLHGQQFKEEIEENIKDLKNRFTQVEKKIFRTIGLNKTIGKAFYTHFDNFTYIKSQQSFLKSLQISFLSMIEKAKNLKGPGIDLIFMLYDYWMKVFKDFILEVWKHSQRYTLNFLKKIKDPDCNIEEKSSNSSKFKEEKRKPWKLAQTQLLEKIIKSGVVFSQARLNDLAEEMGRSTASISSKIQKMIKQKKQEVLEEGYLDTVSLTQKIIEMLKNYPQGLSREVVIERMNEYYEMSFDTNWQKSVSQILSSRKQIMKIKGIYRLQGNHQFDLSKRPFKDKVINCFLRCPEHKADMKTLLNTYINLYGKMEGLSILSDERKKVKIILKQTIEASISKAISRYDIFDKSSSKTVYRLSESMMDVESYLS